MRALSSQWFQHHRARMACWHHDDLGAIRHQLQQMQHEIDELEAELAQQRDTTPTAVHITATLEGAPMTTYAPGQTATFTATSTNTEQQTVADTYTWTTTAGTIVPGNDDTSITISDAPLGDLTVTATDPAGLADSVTVTIADTTPTAVTVTAS